jgi:hypothetical protein
MGLRRSPKRRDELLSKMVPLKRVFGVCLWHGMDGVQADGKIGGISLQIETF